MRERLAEIAAPDVMLSLVLGRLADCLPI
jgi:hypothetical protein